MPASPVLQHGSVDDAVGQGLPLGGREGGTLYDAFQEGEPLSGVIRAKTGTLDNTDGVPDKPGTKALSGYVPLEGGGSIEFAMLLNGETITNKTEYRPIWELFATTLAASPSTARPALHDRHIVGRAGTVPAWP